jgi:CRISPR-associated protein Cmr6
MVMANAFKKAESKEKKKGKDIKINVPDVKLPIVTVETDPEQVPMMYRAQIQGRCSLQFIKDDNHDLQNWLEEWIYPDSDNQNRPFYQRTEPCLGLDGKIYRLKLEFPFRVCSNCGQDNIVRPVIGKHGIPFIPGSGIKGLFERLSRNSALDSNLQAKIKEYCGSIEEPGILRFHGAYPIGDWAATVVTFDDKGQEKTENRYRISDVVHPQENKQIRGIFKSNAIAQISLYKPILIFELSSKQTFSVDQWQEIGGLLKRALRQGLGGKTSTEYGLWVLPQDRYPLSINLTGIGVSSLLRNDEPEFRPNLFKATLKGHLTRLLGGICSNEDTTKTKIANWFGNSSKPGNIQIYWESKPNFPIFEKQGNEKTAIYQVKGTLYVDAPKQDLELFQKLLEFTYIMAGIGKSWRRAWHEGPSQWHSGFYPGYAKRAIGCHWKSDDASFEMPDIKSSDDLKKFLNNLQSYLKNYLKQGNISSQNFKEAWHSNNLTVFSKVVSQSQAIGLFHDGNFKTTPALGGRNPGDDHPTAVSCVWHRMLPIGKDQYLEIVTIFHGDRRPWQREGVDQLKPFIEALKDKGKGLIFTWGKNL